MNKLGLYIKKADLLTFAIIFIFILADFFIWQSAFGSADEMTVSFFDVGQGDAIYIKTPSGKEMIIDGGPSKKIISELGKKMPIHDRSIDILLISNPDKDHIAGFNDVLENFNVALVIESGTLKDTITYKKMEELIKKENAMRLKVRRGEKILLDRDIELSILFPDRDATPLGTNTGSIIAKLKYKNISFMLAGDAPSGVEQYISLLDTNTLQSDVLKVGHHGSKTSTSKEFLEQVKPKYAIISAGKKNMYGHPHKEVIDNLTSANIPFFETSKHGTITFKTNGQKLRYFFE